jgi:hypothetical protein
MCKVQKEVQQTIQCSLCGTFILPSPEGSVGLGYGYLPGTSSPVCYPCCAEEDKRYMRKHGKIKDVKVLQ